MFCLKSENLEYTPYGEMWVEESDDSFDKIPFRYTGKELDEETNLYYMSARYQNPKTSRWMSADPMGAGLINPNRDGFSIVESLNWYSYCSNNPIRYRDPTGMVEAEGADLSNDTYYDSETDSLREPPAELPMESALLDGIGQYNESVSDEIDVAKTSDNISTASGILNQSSEILMKGLGLTAQSTAKVVSAAGKVSAVAGTISILLNGNDLLKDLESGDDLGAIESGSSILSTGLGFINPAVGVTVGVYSKGMIETAKLGAEINVKANNDPLGFMEAMYAWAGVSFSNMFNLGN